MSISLENYPLEVRKLDEKESAEAFQYYKGGYQKAFVRIGPSGYFFNDRILIEAPVIYNMELRPDDIFVISFPKSGTTWTQELVWMVANDCNYELSNTMPLYKRWPFIESSMLFQNEIAQELIDNACKEDPELIFIKQVTNIPVTAIASIMPSPRFIKSHLPFCMLPPNLLEKVKVVYVARDPRDVAVSFFHHFQFMPEVMAFQGDFKAYWEAFKKDMIEWTPYFAHLKQAWALKDHPNLLFLFYEELSKDLAGAIHKVAKFLNKELTDEQVAGLCDHLSFANFKKNKSLNNDIFKSIGLMSKDKHFIRKGKAGGWRDYFDEEMTEEAEKWITDNLRDTDIQFLEC